MRFDDMDGEHPVVDKLIDSLAASSHMKPLAGSLTAVKVCVCARVWQNSFPMQCVPFCGKVLFSVCAWQKPRWSWRKRCRKAHARTPP